MSSLEGRLVARFVLAMSAELVFLAGRTWILRHWPTPDVAQELAWSAWRLPFIAIYFALFRDFLPTRDQRRALPRHPLLILALVFALVSIPVDPRPSDAAYRVVLAATAPIVGIREELIYRGVLQGFLERVLGPIPAILAASFVFTAYHYGSQPFTPWAVTGIYAFGVVLGVIYQRTRNLWLVAALHAIVDALWAAVPQLGIAPGVAMAADALAIVWALTWWRVDRDTAR